MVQLKNVTEHIIDCVYFHSNILVCVMILRPFVYLLFGGHVLVLCTHDEDLRIASK